MWRTLFVVFCVVETVFSSGTIYGGEEEEVLMLFWRLFQLITIALHNKVKKGN
jgi:hypothetical protein